VQRRANKDGVGIATAVCREEQTKMVSVLLQQCAEKSKQRWCLYYYSSVQRRANKDGVGNATAVCKEEQTKMVSVLLQQCAKRSKQRWCRYCYSSVQRLHRFQIKSVNTCSKTNARKHMFIPTHLHSPTVRPAANYAPGCLASFIFSSTLAKACRRSQIYR